MDYGRDRLKSPVETSAGASEIELAVKPFDSSATSSSDRIPAENPQTTTSEASQSNAIFCLCRHNTRESQPLSNNICQGPTLTPTE
jgi:hypothetical protein